MAADCNYYVILGYDLTEYKDTIQDCWRNFDDDYSEEFFEKWVSGSDERSQLFQDCHRNIYAFFGDILSKNCIFETMFETMETKKIPTGMLITLESALRENFIEFLKDLNVPIGELYYELISLPEQIIIFEEQL